MLAAVALILATVVLVKMKRAQYVWVTLVPAIWLIICTTWALALKLFSNDEKMEGFFYMANQYKDRIVTAGAEATPAQLADMKHIVINNYTNAGLSILFLFVVYSIVFYGIRTYLKARNIDHPTDTETPYVPVPKEGIKISSGH